MAVLTVVQAAGLDGRHQIRSVVKADLRTGRLIRTFALVPSPRGAATPANGAPTAETDSAALLRLIDETAGRYSLDPLLVHSVIQVESDYNPVAVSPKGAEGLMQLMPGTARRFEVANAFNPSENIEGGVRYLKYLLETFKDQDLALAAYNAGEKAVVRYGTVPPYPETAEYVRKVGKRHEQARRKAEAEKARNAAAGVAASPVIIEEFIDERGVVHIRTVNR